MGVKLYITGEILVFHHQDLPVEPATIGYIMAKAQEVLSSAFSTGRPKVIGASEHQLSGEIRWRCTPEDKPIEYITRWGRVNVRNNWLSYHSDEV